MRWFSLLVLGCKATPDTPPPDSCVSVQWSTHAEPFVTTWCTGCHASTLPEALRGGAPEGIDFDSSEGLMVFSRAMAAVSVGPGASMPPAGGPSERERERFDAWVQCELPGLPEDDRCVGPTVEGNVTVSERPDLCPDTRWVTGDLVLDGPGAECLCGVGGDVQVIAGRVELPDLRRIQGDLEAVESLATSLLLPALLRVDGRVVLERNNQLEGLALPDLVQTGGVSIRTNPLLSTVEAPVLVQVDGPLAITLNSSLSRIDLQSLRRVGPLDLQDNATLLWVEAPSALEALDVLDLSNTPMLSELRGFEGLDEIGAVRVAFSGVTQIRAFGDVRTADTLEFVELPALDRLRGFASLERVNGRLRLEKLPALETVTAFEHLRSVGGPLAWVGLSGTPSISMPLLTAVEGPLRIGENPDVQSLAPFATLTEIGGLEVVDNASLMSLSGLDGIVVIRGDVRIETNPELLSLEGLGNVQRIEGDLLVRDNASLGLEEVQVWLQGIAVDGTLHVE